MNALTDTPKSARNEGSEIIVEMQSGEQIRFPVSLSSRLSSAISAQLGEITLSPFGLHWPQLDEDLSIRAILAYIHLQK